jgi:hypothetical protein
MNTISAMILGALLALTPSVLVVTWAVWRDGKLPAPRETPIIDMARELRSFADHIIDPVASPEDLAVRLRVISAAKALLAAAGYTFTINEYRNVVIEDGDRRESK